MMLPIYVYIGPVETESKSSKQKVNRMPACKNKNFSVAVPHVIMMELEK